MSELPSEEHRKILAVLRPYAANWTGTLGRGDLVVPQREIPRLINDLLEAIASERLPEVSDRELFDALCEARRSASLQDQATRLRQTFHILKR